MLYIVEIVQGDASLKLEARNRSLMWYAEARGDTATALSQPISALPEALSLVL